MYLTFAGLSTDAAASRPAVPAPSSWTPTRPSTAPDPSTDYALYGVAAVQVILAAIAKSDGTRKGVIDQVFGGGGHHDPGRRLRASARRSRSTRRPVTSTPRTSPILQHEGRPGDVPQGLAGLLTAPERSRAAGGASTSRARPAAARSAARAARPATVRAGWTRSWHRRSRRRRPPGRSSRRRASVPAPVGAAGYLILGGRGRLGASATSCSRPASSSPSAHRGPAATARCTR